MALYDPTPRETIVSPEFSVAELLAFAQSKPADEAYNYWDGHRCAMFQFLKASGAPVRQAGGCGSWWDTSGNEHNERIPAGVLSGEPCTWGALVKRLEALNP